MEIEVRKKRIAKKLVISVSIATVVFILALIPFIVIKPVLNINQDHITLPVNEEFKENFYNATYMNIDITHLVRKEGTLDNNKIGDYTLKYYIEMGFNMIQTEIIVTVTDSVAPNLTLYGKNSIELCDDTYQEEGYVAIDNYDGNITDKVTIIKEKDKNIYSVSDSSGNTTSAIRTFTACSKKKTKAKEESFYISLKGSQTMYVPLNTEYVEQGAIAHDSVDGDLTVNISSNIDNTTPGHYEVIYSATNSKNETITKTRDVYIFDTNTIQNLSGGEQGVIYLTFDDGPSAYTSTILDILDKYQIKATFFVTNSGSDNTILDEYNRGHAIGLHTATHQWSIYSSAEAYFNDLSIISNRVYNITGLRTMLIRFPGGSSNTVSRKYKKGIMTYLTSEVLNRGYHYFDWNVCVEDAGACAKKSSYEDRKTCVKNYFINGLSKSRSNIVLLHDIKKYTMESLEDMIQYAIKEGYTFDKLTMNTEQIHMRVNN